MTLTTVTVAVVLLASLALLVLIVWELLSIAVEVEKAHR